MWWLAIPPAVAVGVYAVKKAFGKSEPVRNVSRPKVSASPAKKIIKKEDNNVNNSGQNSYLESNFQKLDRILSNNLGSIKVAIIGQPGAGKSAMLAGITNKRCLPLPVIGQKTDATFWHKGPISNFFNSYQHFRFVDAPGYDTYLHPVETYLKYFPFSRFDFVLLVIKGKIHMADEKVFFKLKQIFGSSISEKVLVIRSFADDLSKKERVLITNDFDDKFNFNINNIGFYFISNRYNYGIDDLKMAISIS